MTSRTTRRTPSTALLAASLVACVGCDGPVATMGFSGATMGTSYEVLVEAELTALDSVAIGALVERELDRVNRLMSTYDPASDVSRFGAYLGVDPVPVDPLLLEILDAALEVCRRSGGAFDATVAPLVDAWGFGPDDVLELPDSARVADLRKLVGCGALAVEPAAGTLSKARAGTRIDLSGIAKGFAAGRIGAALLESGYENALVDVGGELRAVGAHLSGRPWRVAVEGPGDGSPQALVTIDLIDEAIATSGDFRNYYEDGGVRYAHLIDPRTGFPIPYRGFSVSVVHADATLADAWATALTVLGPDEGFALAEQEGLATLFSWQTAEGVESRATAAIQGRITPF